MIPYSKQNITKEDEDVLKKALFDPFLTQGPKVGEFENSLSQKHNCADAVACSSGSAALHLAYAACGIDQDGIETSSCHYFCFHCQRLQAPRCSSFILRC